LLRPTAVFMGPARILGRATVFIRQWSDQAKKEKLYNIWNIKGSI
jgi:hypothetical protein